jgi:ParB-like chromosome segregation protein Spo0J
METMQRIESWPVDRLRPHPENATIFGDPEESEAFAEIAKSIKAHGIWEPLCVKADGTILSGHLRFSVAQHLRLKAVPVRVFDPFASYIDEVRFVVRSNTDRRQLLPQEIALAFKRLKEIPREQGGAKAKMGRRKSGESPRLLQTRDVAAKQIGVPVDVARACEKVFTTPGVPAELKAAVNRGAVAPTTAAKAVRAEEKRQGGEIKSATALVAIATEPLKPARVEPSHEQRMAMKAEAFRMTYARLVKAYREIDAVLTSMPLTSIIGPTEHHEYGTLIRDVALRAWREVEQVQGGTNAGRQMALTVIKGGGK